MVSDLIVQETATIVPRWKVQESISCLAHKAGCLNWSSMDTGMLKRQALMAVRNGLTSESKASFFHEFI